MGKKSHHKHHQLTTRTNNNNAEAQSVEFIQHVHEFRSRIFWVVLLFIVSSALAYQYRDILVDLVLSPLGDQKLIYLTPAGGFSFIFQITMYAGAIISAPVLVFQLYKFVTPALPARARRHAATVFIAAFLLMCSGVAFGYLVAVPSALSFLTTFAGGYVDASLTADSYLGFIIAYVFGLGILFQLPLLLIFWHWIKPLTPKQLLSSERFMVIFSLIAAAVITPTPDVVNQMIIAGPILVVYQIGVIVVLLMIRAERRRTRFARRAGVQVSAVERAPLPSFVLPSAEDLAPRKRAVAPQASSSVTIVKKPSIAMPKVVPVPLRSHVAVAPNIPQRATEGTTLRPRPVISSRPLPQVSRQRMVSLDGFVVSS